MMSHSQLDLTRFSMPLLQWYEQNRRDLPWRRSHNPYHIWVSEVMLQQTRVETVIPYYHRFIDRFPTIDALAEAPEEELLKLWEGLGYYSRARNLQSAVREVKESYGSKVPDDRASFSSLKGVGPYTTGAVLSIAYNKPEPAVDGNVFRVLSRFFLIEDDIMKASTRTRMEKLARELIPEGRAGDFNQALMELGATVCTPKSPYCLTCPVMEHCSARLEGREMTLPVKTKAKPPRPEKRAAVFVTGTGEHSGQWLIRQRPSEGLLARMWELPHVLLTEPAEQLPGDKLFRAFAEEGILLDELEPAMRAEHTFSHIHWDMQVYYGVLSLATAGVLPGPEYRWIGAEELDTHAFPNIFVRIIQALRKCEEAGG
jgi:A/G-specific adenine glycosylase